MPEGIQYHPQDLEGTEVTDIHTSSPILNQTSRASENHNTSNKTSRNISTQSLNESDKQQAATQADDTRPQVSYA
jgi:hypothetical protein